MTSFEIYSSKYLRLYNPVRPSVIACSLTAWNKSAIVIAISICCAKIVKKSVSLSANSSLDENTQKRPKGLFLVYKGITISNLLRIPLITLLKISSRISGMILFKASSISLIVTIFFSSKAFA